MMKKTIATTIVTAFIVGFLTTTYTLVIDVNTLKASDSNRDAILGRIEKRTMRIESILMEKL